MRALRRLSGLLEAAGMGPDALRRTGRPGAGAPTQRQRGAVEVFGRPRIGRRAGDRNPAHRVDPTRSGGGAVRGDDDDN
jgi:hypothetical protein